MLAEAPDEFLAKRRALMNEMETAEEARRQASDARAAAETGLGEADRIARLALDAMSVAREEKARSESRVEAMRQRVADILRTIEVELECGPEQLAELAGVKPGASNCRSRRRLPKSSRG